jgi:hypothetical protein
MFLIPSMLGACFFYFLGAPIERRVFGVDPLDPERVERFGDSVADLILRGISRRGESSE